MELYKFLEVEDPDIEAMVAILVASMREAMRLQANAVAISDNNVTFITASGSRASQSFPPRVFNVLCKLKDDLFRQAVGELKKLGYGATVAQGELLLNDSKGRAVSLTLITGNPLRAQ